jgi:protein-disulfide isomerase
MSANFFAAILDAVTSRKGAALVAPAVLLLGAALAVGQDQAASAGASAASGPAAPAAVTQVSDKTAPTPAGNFSESQRKEIEAIIKDYLVANPEVLFEAQNALEAKMDKIQAERTAMVLKEKSAEIFHPAASHVIGNADGDVPIVEFMDYNCGYCRRAMPDIAKLVEKDKKVKLVLKDFPVLVTQTDRGSEEAAHVAIAARMQGKYWEFHTAMMNYHGRANEASALKVAEKLGLDMARLKKDMASPEVKKEIQANFKLASTLGVQGTPYFLVGDHPIPGAPENLSEMLTQYVEQVRKDGCKAC